MFYFLNHFNPKMPLFLVYKLQELNYDYDKFLSWYMRLPDITEGYKTRAQISSKRAKFFWISSYYFWTIYLAASVYVATFNFVFGLAGFLFSPLVVAGYLSSASYSLGLLKSTKKK